MIGWLWATRRRLVFTYDLAILVLLVLVGIFYAKYVREADSKSIYHLFVIPSRYQVFAHCMWLGAMGGVVISLKGVYDNAGNPPWSNSYNLWHLGRPFSGAITGLVTVLIFVFLSPNGQLNRPVVYLAAFILGTQEARFFNFLGEIGRLIVQVPASAKTPGLRLTAVQPANGRAGTLVIVAGQALAPGAVVKIGGARLENQVVAPEGNSVAGNVPKLGGTVPRTVDITVLIPGGGSAMLADQFTYDGD